MREVVTLASIVELETARADERPRIAAVFLNRLEGHAAADRPDRDLRAASRPGRWDGNIRKRDLEIDSPYNTYRYAGPAARAASASPGPRSDPGRARAAPARISTS